MHFSSDINRPPSEAGDGFLQVTSGCSHGRCEFCTFYKDAHFRISPMEEIKLLSQPAGEPVQHRQLTG